VKQIEDNETLTQRNSLLGELITKRQGSDPLGASLSVEKALASAKPVERKPTDFTEHEMRYMLSIALLELRVALQGLSLRSKTPDFRSTEFCAWGGLLMPGIDLWLDLVILADAQPAEKLFEASLGRKPQNDQETSGFMAEMARMVSIGFGRMLTVRVGEVVHPLMTRGTRLWTLPAPVPLPYPLKSYDLLIENLPFRLSLSTEPCPKKLLSPEGVRVLDILAGPFPPREISPMPMFNAGVLMTPRFIEKMLTHDVAVQQGDCALIRRPTKFARYFNT